MRSNISILVFLLPLSGCLADKTPVAVKTELVVNRVPPILLRPCTETVVPVETTGDVIRQNRALSGDLAACNAKLTGIAAWDAAQAAPVPASKPSH